MESPVLGDERHARNLLVPGVGPEGQERLTQARVAIAGLGGLGSAAAYYLAAAGVGALGLIDSDAVELSNLQRQILHTTDRIGQSKTASAAEALSALDPGVSLQAIRVRLDETNAADVLSSFDVIVEATDNFDSKYLLNDTAIELGKPLATAGILSWSGHAQFVVPGQSPCLRCAVPAEPQGVPTTSQFGVIGAVAGMMGCLQAAAVIRWLTGQWQPEPDESGALHSFDGDAMRLSTICVKRRAHCRCAPLWST